MLIAKQTPAWKPSVSPMQMITKTVSVHLRWRIENPNLYEYLTRHPLSDDASGVAAIHDVNNTVATNLSAVIGAVLRTFGLGEGPAAPLGFGAVGFVESATTQWLNDPAPTPLAEFTTQLSEWMWSLWDCTLQLGGVHLDPHQPIVLQLPAVPVTPPSNAGRSGPCSGYCAYPRAGSQRRYGACWRRSGDTMSA